MLFFFPHALIGFCPLDLTDLVKMPDKFDLLEKIGEGSYGLVFKARDKTTHNIIAVKLIDKVSLFFALLQLPA